jgi:membrane fusion protein (multidrug efflux system)
MNNSKWFTLSVLIAVLCVLGPLSCGSDRSVKAAGGGAPPPMPVSVVEVHQQDIPLYSEYAAQTYARDIVEVRGRVDGFIEKRTFQAGQDVQAGQLLFTLDLRPYAADVQKAKADLAQSEANFEFAKKQVSLLQAQANLAQAKANLLKAQQDVDRLQPLVAQDAAAKQDLDAAQAALDANKANVASLAANVEQTRLQTRTNIDAAAAQVESNRALLRTAELNLGYASITAPVSGRIGDSLIPVGGLVSKSASQPLTTIVPLDPMWVRFKISESEYLHQQASPQGWKAEKPELRLLLADGSTFPQEGQIRDTLNQVDQKTGTLEVQATFPNPNHVLLPGQFGRIRLLSREAKNVIVIPQRAIQEMQNMQSVFTIGPDNKAEVRAIVTGERTGDDWIVLQGLKPGDKVVVEGMQKIGPGSPVQATPYKPPAAAAASSERGQG